MAIKCCARNWFFDTIIGINPIDSCPLIIGEYATYDDIPAGTAVDQLAIVRYIDAGLGQIIILYEWTGVAWGSQMTLTATASGGLFTSVDISNDDGNWEASVDDGVSYHTSSTVPINPPSATLPVWFRNLDNGCVYTNVPQLPLEASYCVDYFEMDITDPFFFFGTINGIQADDTANVLATYANWEGNLTAIPYNNFLGSVGIVTIFRDSLTPAFTNLGTYVPFGGGDPVIWEPPTTLCTTNCYQAVFTVNDITEDGVSYLESTIGTSVDTDEIPFTDPTWADQYLQICINAGFLEPTATMTYSLNGNEVTMTICSVMPMISGLWSNDDGSISGTITFTQL